MKNKELHNKETGFNTPKEYFNTFEERLFDRIKTEAVIPKETGFKTPDSYFDNLEDSLSKTLFETKKETEVIPLQRKRNYIHYLSYAAAACILFFVAINLIPTTTGTDADTLKISEIDTSEIDAFIENDLIALNNYDLMLVYEEENVDMSTIFEVNLDETETIDYLENRSDPYDLLDE